MRKFTAPNVAAVRAVAAQNYGSTAPNVAAVRAMAARNDGSTEMPPAGTLTGVLAPDWVRVGQPTERAQRLAKSAEEYEEVANNLQNPEQREMHSFINILSGEILRLDKQAITQAEAIEALQAQVSTLSEQCATHLGVLSAAPRPHPIPDAQSKQAPLLLREHVNQITQMTREDILGNSFQELAKAITKDTNAASSAANAIAANAMVIELALSLEDKDTAAQKAILIQLFGSDDFGSKRQYKKLAIQLHPDKNKTCVIDATKAMQLFLSAVDHQIAVLAEGSFLDKVVVDRVKLGLRLIGQAVELKNLGPWSSVPITLVDFNEETLCFKAEKLNGAFWTGLLAIHPQDAKVNNLIRLNSAVPADVVGDLARLEPQPGNAYRISKSIINSLSKVFSPQTLVVAPLDFIDFGPQQLLKLQNLEVLESHWLMLDTAFTLRLQQCSSSSTSIAGKVEARVLEVLPQTAKRRLGIVADRFEIAFVQICNPFEQDDSLILGQISHNLVEAFVLRQRLGSSQMLALEQQAEARLLQREDQHLKEVTQEQVAQGQDNADASNEATGGTPQDCLALRVANEVDKLIMDQRSKDFMNTVGTGILHHDANQDETLWFEFSADSSPLDHLKRLVGRSGLCRSGIEPVEKIKFVRVLPRSAARQRKTDEYLISLHAFLGASNCSSTETVNSKLLDDMISSGALQKCNAPQIRPKETPLSICNNAQPADDKSGYSKTRSAEEIRMLADNTTDKRQRSDYFVELVESALGKTISLNRAEKLLDLNEGDFDQALNDLT